MVRSKPEQVSWYSVAYDDSRCSLFAIIRALWCVLRSSSRIYKEIPQTRVPKRIKHPEPQIQRGEDKHLPPKTSRTSTDPDISIQSPKDRILGFWPDPDPVPVP